MIVEVSDELGKTLLALNLAKRPRRHRQFRIFPAQEGAQPTLEQTAKVELRKAPYLRIVGKK